MMACRRRRLIAILPAIEIAMKSIISIEASFSHFRWYFQLNSFVLHYSRLPLHVCSLCLLCIPSTSHTFALQKVTLCNTCQRPRSTTFHPNLLSMHLQMWIGSMRIQSGLVFHICSADVINANWVRIRCASNAQCGHAYNHTEKKVMTQSHCKLKSLSPR